MKLYDCFMFSDETMLLKIRLNILHKFVDKFIISEARYLHNGKEKKLNFNIKNFSEFKDKIEYIVVEQPPKLLKIYREDTKKNIEEKKILNSMRLENHQRQMLVKGLKDLNSEDIILISDIDEIPNLENNDINKINNEIIIFKQKMFYYKFNLYYENFEWFGSKAIRKKNFVSPQWLRNIKSKNYPIWRVDVFFSKTKYHNIKFIDDGGWHFTCIKSPEEVHKKLLTFAHHQDYQNSEITLDTLKERMVNKQALYNHSLDKKNNNKWITDKKLKKMDLEYLPSYLKNNKKSFEEWFEN